MMQVPTQASFLSASDEYIPGMNDAEELKRMGRSMADTDGLGEVLVELDDFAELGLRDE